MKRNKKRILRYLPHITVVLLAVSLMVAAHTFKPQIVNALDKLNLIPRPETFTELYFEDHTNLPNKVTLYKTYKFSFTIHNLENKNYTYPYEIYIKRGEIKIPLNRGTVEIKKDGYKTITEEFGPLKNLRSQIVVELVDKKQSIHFWMEVQ